MVTVDTDRKSWAIDHVQIEPTQLESDKWTLTNLPTPSHRACLKLTVTNKSLATDHVKLEADPKLH